jgi:predicted AAA+ superfamily ATPase
VEFPLLKNFIVSVIGPRRAGKTYSLYDLILNKRGLREEVLPLRNGFLL